MILRRLIPFALAASAAVSCGLSAEYSGIQQFQDGIYFKPSNAPAAAIEPLSQEDFQARARQEIARDKALRRDTLYVLSDGSNTTLQTTKGDTYNVYTYQYSNVYDPFYASSWYFGYPYYGYRYRYYGWYDPWDYWHSPWYRPWYSPWYGYSYYGYYGWYDPWDYWYDPYYYRHNYYYGGGPYWRNTDYYLRHNSNSDMRAMQRGNNGVNTRGAASVVHGSGYTGRGIDASSSYNRGAAARSSSGYRTSSVGSRVFNQAAPSSNSGSQQHYSGSSRTGNSGGSYSRSSGSGYERSSSYSNPSGSSGSSSSRSYGGSSSSRSSGGNYSRSSGGGGSGGSGSGGGSRGGGSGSRH